MKQLDLLRRLLILVSAITLCFCTDGKVGEYTNSWAVEVQGDERVAESLAEQYGMRLAGRVGTLDNIYLFENKRLQKRSASEHVSFTDAVQHDPRVRWAAQQRVLKRVKRDFLESRERSRVRPPVDSAYPQRLPAGKVSPVQHAFQFNDAYYDQQWYVHGYVGAHMANVADMRVQQAWNLSYSGKGVVVTILDDGVEHTHADLIDNYDPLASFDLNNNDTNPFPRYDVTNENRHGTRCAGVVAAMANNSVCVVGIAYGARIGGVRMLDGDITDVVEARALSLASQYIDIYSASWGPDDSGSVVDGPGPLAMRAFQQGVERGRGGLGSIYVWASGNGGGSDDSCALDGYANAIYTLSVGSVSQWNVRPWYLEECASTLVTTYSSGEPREAQVASTDIRNRCTLQHTGTSASAPLAAGIIALVLEANPKLNWRDVQYIAMLAANHTPFKDANWIVNGVRRKVSLRYGYGLMNAYIMVRLAEVWSNVPTQRSCRLQSDVLHRRRALSTREVTVSINADRCSYVLSKGNAHNIRNSTIRYLEHVQAVITLRYHRRGDLQITLVSPSGTKSVLMPKRRYDHKPDGLNNWVLTSVHFWGESPAGVWKLILENVGYGRSFSGELIDWSLNLYGVGTRPLRIRRANSDDTLHTPSLPLNNNNFGLNSSLDMSTRRRVSSKPGTCIDCGRSRPRGRSKLDDADSARSRRERRTQVTATVENFEPYVSPEIDARLAAMRAYFVDYDGPCHTECSGKCDGPADHDCFNCRHARLPDRYGLNRCVPFAEDEVDESDAEAENDQASDSDGENFELDTNKLHSAAPSLSIFGHLPLACALVYSICLARLRLAPS